jgi:hypothetical protein
LVTSREYIANQVQNAYLFHLGRYADPPGLNFWVNYIHDGGRTYWDGRLDAGMPAWHVAASVVKSYEAMSDGVVDDYLVMLNRASGPARSVPTHENSNNFHG